MGKGSRTLGQLTSVAVRVCCQKFACRQGNFNIIAKCPQHPVFKLAWIKGAAI